jgi:hypothetical protein
MWSAIQCSLGRPSAPVFLAVGTRVNSCPFRSIARVETGLVPSQRRRARVCARRSRGLSGVDRQVGNQADLAQQLLEARVGAHRVELGVYVEVAQPERTLFEGFV